MTAKHLFLPRPRTRRSSVRKKLANAHSPVRASLSSQNLARVLRPLALLEWAVSRMGSHLHVSRLGIVFIVAFASDSLAMLVCRAAARRSGFLEVADSLVVRAPLHAGDSPSHWRPNFRIDFVRNIVHLTIRFGTGYPQCGTRSQEALLRQRLCEPLSWYCYLRNFSY
jgi:hypothetical protein